MQRSCVVSVGAVISALVCVSCGGGSSASTSGGGGGGTTVRNVACTYFGGSQGGIGNDRAQGMTLLPGSENVVICGNTTSDDFAAHFPGLAGWHKNFAGGSDAFIAILSKDLSSVLAWTYFGGDDEDRAYAVRVDANGDIWCSGFTSSGNFPTLGGTPHHGPRGNQDAFVVRFTANLGSLQFATCIGGSGDESPRASMELDQAGNVYLSGMTNSSDFPVQATSGNTLFQASLGGGDDGWIAKLDASGAILWCTYFGGADNDSAWSGVRVHPDQQSIYIGGYTRSDTAHGFPAQNAYDTTYNGDEGPAEPTLGDGFVARISSTGQVLACTYIGGASNDNVSPNESVFFTAAHQVAVVGQTRSEPTGANAFPITTNAYQSVHHGPSNGPDGNDVYVAVFDESLTTLEYCSYFGGSAPDDVSGLFGDASGRLVFTGNTKSADFPTTPDAFQTHFAGAIDATLVSFSFDANHTVLHYATLMGGSALVGSGFEGQRGRSLAIRPSDGLVVFSGDADTTDFPTTPNTLSPNFIGGASDAIVGVHDMN